MTTRDGQVDESGGPFVAAEIAASALELAERVQRRVVLGITGPPGAGKSTVANALRDALGDDGAIVPMDGFHLSNRVLVSLQLQDRKGAPDTFDVRGYVDLLQRLTAHADSIVYAPSFDRTTDEPIAADIAIHPSARVVVTEGNYLLLPHDGWLEVRSRLDRVYFVDVDPQTRLDRLAKRHVEFGKNPIEATRWANGPDETNARLVAATRAFADAALTIQ